MAPEDRGWQPVSLPSEYPPPVGAYSPAVRAGDFVFVSGQVPTNPRTGKVETEDFAEQAALVLDKVRVVLEAGGATLDDVVSVIVYLADIDDWGTFNDIYKRTLRPPYPSRTAVGAQLRGFKVEVSAVAYRRR